MMQKLSFELMVIDNDMVENKSCKKMKSVLISIQPKWCELIASSQKTIEVRKTKPKIDTPFKCYIYCTYARYAGKRINNLYMNRGTDKRFIANGKVIGEFICDKIYYIAYSMYPHDPLVFEELGTLNRPNVLSETCLSNTDIDEYLNVANGYGWRISDLKIYDKPKALSEFYRYCTDDDDCDKCEYNVHPHDSGFDTPCNTGGRKYFNRPPQSWCYVEA